MSIANDPAVPLAAANSQTSLSPAKGLLALGVIILIVAAYIALCMAVGTKEFYGGFLFALYWTGIEQMKMEKLASSVVGALVGLLLAFLGHALPEQMGQNGFFLFLAIILVAVYCQVMGWLPLAINMSTMLFLTAGTIPYVASNADFTGILLSLIIGIVFFGGLASCSAS
jgi:hypothetical protein